MATKGAGGWGRDGVGDWGQQMSAFAYGTDNKVLLTVWHKERYSVFVVAGSLSLCLTLHYAYTTQESLEAIWKECGVIPKAYVF